MRELETLSLNQYGKALVQNLKYARPRLLKELRQSGDLRWYVKTTQENAQEYHDQLRASLRQQTPPPQNSYPKAVARHDRIERTAKEIVMAEMILLEESLDTETGPALRQGVETTESRSPTE